METNNKEYENYQKAYKKVQDIKGFYSHLTSYIVVMCVVVFVNLKYTPDHLWFFYPMLGWGFGVAGHAMSAFNYIPFLGKDWEEKKLQQYIEEEKNKENVNYK
ncbi:2TM domain-containing protein [Flavobacterium sp.]|uniref:2TM domain-containing protein n=1 Tax=Flavobacterium sp. TaxID=239 RepID=UPI00286D8416|nr:2TM domain-containing protein [Flavobacterium sp.]